MVQPHLVPSLHSEGLASEENQISLVSIHPGKWVAKPASTLLLAELSAGGAWQGVFCVCCVLPGSAALLSEARGSCCGEPRSPVPSGSLTRWLRAPCGSASEDGCNTHLGVSVAFLHRSCGHLQTDEEPFCFHFADGKGEALRGWVICPGLCRKSMGEKGIGPFHTRVPLTVPWAS